MRLATTISRLALAPEEEQRVELGVLEGVEPLVRRVGLRVMPPRACRSSSSTYACGSTSSAATSNRRQNACASGLGSTLHRPRPIADRPLAPDPVEDEPQVPVGHLVPEEQEVASAQLRRERDRDDRAEIGASEVVDVVVLGDDEALPLPLGKRIDRAVELQQDCPALERELRRVRVGHVDRPRSFARWAMPEAAAVRPARHVRDDVELFPLLLERTLESQVEVRGHDQLVRRASRPEQRG